MKKTIVLILMLTSFTGYGQIKRTFTFKNKTICTKSVVKASGKDITYAIYTDGKFTAEAKTKAEAELAAKAEKTIYVEVTKDDIVKLIEEKEKEIKTK
jgi:hypothetical protein